MPASLSQMRHWIKELRRRRFVDQLYRRELQREPDPAGFRHHVEILRRGASRSDVIKAIRDSQEYKERRTVSERTDLPDLRRAAPEYYGVEIADDGSEVPVFSARNSNDFDWIENAIVEHGYYEAPGVWSLGIDLDKQVMAELISRLKPASVLEVGCASGAVLHGLNELGIDVTGVDISEYAKNLAPATIRDRILIGDLATLNFAGVFDLGFGLDIFEHISPNRIRQFITALSDAVKPGGFIVGNIPAFGKDRVFGEVFPICLESWRTDAAAGQPFRHLQVDDHGFPMHGHLIWATTDWWEAEFAQVGLRRETRLEVAIQGTYRVHFEQNAPARKSMYVFSKGAEEGAVDRLAALIESQPSTVLNQEVVAAHRVVRRGLRRMSDRRMQLR